MRVLITGGGTAGHIFPGTVLASQLLKENSCTEILFVGAKGGLDEDLVSKEGFDFKPIRSSGLPRRFSWQAFRTGFRALVGFWQSIWILRRFGPDVVLGTGGYSSGPVVLAAWVLRIPIIIHEQNILPGFTNRILVRFASRVVLSFEDSASYIRGRVAEVIGNPVRPQIWAGRRSAGLKNLGLRAGRFNLLVFGGSRGAHSINLAMKRVLEEIPSSLKSKLQILHITGFRDFELGINTYKNSAIDGVVRPFIYNMEDAYAAADLVVCRAGATALAEIAACGKPGVLIPYPHATANHQLRNAEFFAKKGAALVVLDGELQGPKLAETIVSLIEDRERLSRMARSSRSLGTRNREAAPRIVQLIRELAKKGKGAEVSGLDL